MRSAVVTPKLATQKDPRWAAVVARDKTADTAFCYAVETTGVYCRPSCPARLARPEHVSFHRTPADAERAGFRACKRCKPNEASAAHPHATAIGRACRAIEAAETAPSLQDLAGAAGLSASHFHRLFKALTGVTPRAYAMAHRGGRVRRALARGASVTEAIYESGFQSNGRFYASYRALLGMKPADYRAGGRAAEIRFAVGACTLGSVLVAASGQGVCAILLGDDPDALARDLQDAFPRATFIGDDPHFEALVARVVGLVEAPALGLDLPLDIRGTAFQRRVWEALQRIPSGSTASYTEIASALGCPKAVRAVASACASNKLAVVIPCHRVVRRDGGLSGYRWGVERKRALLATEAKVEKTPRART